MTTAPLPRKAGDDVIDSFDEDFSAFVFKIQANMNKAHRTESPLCASSPEKFEADREVYHIQGGKKIRLSRPQQLMAAEREIIEEAYAGDIIGVFDPGIFSIGDTLCAPSRKFCFDPIPTFAPEHFERIRSVDTMKRKQFLKGVEQIAQEGAIQIFKTPYSGMEEVIVGVVGTLQFDVLEYRLRSEYNVELYKEGLPYEYLRWIVREEDAPPLKEEDLLLPNDAKLVEDYKGEPAAAVRLPVVHPVGQRPEQGSEAGRVRRREILKRGREHETKADPDGSGRDPPAGGQDPLPYQPRRPGAGRRPGSGGSGGYRPLLRRDSSGAAGPALSALFHPDERGQGV